MICLEHIQNFLVYDKLRIDTEGGEYDIVKNIDLNKYNIKIFVIENKYNDNKINQYLQSNGYKYISKLSIHDVYLKV